MQFPFKSGVPVLFMVALKIQKMCVTTPEPKNTCINQQQFFAGFLVMDVPKVGRIPP